MTGIARHLVRKTVSQLTQGSTLTFRSKVPCSVVFQPEWRDDGAVSFLDQSVNVDIRTLDQELRTSLGRVAPHISINVEPAASIDVGNIERTLSDTALPHITVQIPEKTNLQCDLLAENSSVSIPGKIEGDVSIQTGENGVIHAKKLRGHSIDLQAEQIIISDLLEAASLRVLTNGRFRAKQVHCSKADIQVFESPREVPCIPEVTYYDYDPDDEHSLVDISALFISTGNDAGGGASVKIHPRQRPISRRAVRIKSNHGPVLVETMGLLSPPTEMNEFTDMHFPLVELGGVNGQCEVSVLGSVATESSHNNNWVSCQVHLDSLSAGSVSLVTADCGHVAITVDRKVAADLRLLSHESKETLLESGSLLAEEEDAEMTCAVLKKAERERSTTATPDEPRVDDEDSIAVTRIFEKNSSFSMNGMEYVECVVENKSAEPDSRFDRQSGKVRIDGAGSQALSRFSSNSEYTDEKPLFAVVSVGNVILETVSWFGAIARRYGLEESERELGRTASRRGRLFAPPPTTRS